MKKTKIIPDTHQKCRCCGEWLPLHTAYFAMSSKTGTYFSVCHDCQQEKRLATLEQRGICSKTIDYPMSAAVEILKPEYWRFVCAGGV